MFWQASYQPGALCNMAHCAVHLMAEMECVLGLWHPLLAQWCGK